MDLDRAILERKSIRAYLDKPVEKALLEEIFALAVRAPSWANTQPWEIAVIGGQAKKELSEEMTSLTRQGTPPKPDFEMPAVFSGVYKERSQMVGKKVFELAGIARDDTQARFNQFLSMFNGFGAPCLIYILLDEVLTTVYSVFDAGAIANYISLLAASRGLGTCIMAALAMYPEPVRKKLNLPDNKKIVIGMSIGYPDNNSLVNKVQSDREDLCKTVSWLGMDK
jgi:nitroreductase